MFRQLKPLFRQLKHQADAARLLPYHPLEIHRNTNGRGLEHSVTMQTLMTGGPCTDRIQEITTSTTWSGLGSGMSMISRWRTWVGLSTGMILGARMISWKIGASTDGAIERSMIGKQIQP